MSNIEKAVLWAADLSVELAKGFEDGKLNFVEVIALWDNAAQIPALAKGLKEFPKEWAQYKDNNEYWQKVTQQVESRLDFTDPLVSSLVVNTIKAGLAIKDVILVAVEINKKK